MTFLFGYFFLKKVNNSNKTSREKKNIKRFLKQFVVCLLKCSGCMYVCLFDLSALFSGSILGWIVIRWVYLGSQEVCRRYQIYSWT
jgi:hypothetical protein